MWDFVYISIYSSTNVWFGKGYVVFSDPVGDRRHFNRDDYGIWFTNMWINFFSWTGSILHRQQGTFLFYSAVGALGKCWGGGIWVCFFSSENFGKSLLPPPLNCFSFIMFGYIYVIRILEIFCFTQGILINMGIEWWFRDFMALLQISLTTFKKTSISK